MRVGSFVLLLSMATTSCASAPALLARPTSADAVVESVDERGGDGPDRVRFRAAVCEGVSLKVEQKTLDTDAVKAMLIEGGLEVDEIRQRADLVYFDARGADLAQPIRLRVAILATPEDAAQELHNALLQAGKGAWGFHRGNVAVLAPPARFQDVLVFAAKTKLACRGVLTVSTGSEAYVVAGAYAEP